MSVFAVIDELWEDFARGLPADLRADAAALSVSLRFTSSADPRWSRAFAHEITLGAPLLVAEGMPSVPAALVRDAARAHLLAMVEAFGTDRLLDGQLDLNPAIPRVIEAARAARDAALARVLPAAVSAGDLDLTYTRADHEMAAAMREEDAVFRGGEPASWPRYLRVARSKKRVARPASLSLAVAAGWDARRRRALSRLLDAVCVALQIDDDVIGWEADLYRGGAWAASLAAQVPFRSDPRDRKTVPVSARRLVSESGALLRMVQQSVRSFRAARRLAGALGLTRLAAWARAREAHAADLVNREAATPGIAGRAHDLAGWAKAAPHAP